MKTTKDIYDCEVNAKDCICAILFFSEDNVYDYQEDCRFYLDEYPEQKKLREEYFRPETIFYNRWIKRN